MSNASPKPALTSDEAAIVHSLIGTHGMRRAAGELAISAQTAAKIAAGLPVSRAVVSHVRARLRELDAIRCERAEAASLLATG